MDYMVKRKELYEEIYSRVSSEFAAYSKKIFEEENISSMEFANSYRIYEYLFRECVVNVFHEIVTGKRVDAKLSNENLETLLNQWNILNYICEDRYLSYVNDAVYDIIVAQASAKIY